MITEKQLNRYNIFVEKNGKEVVDSYILRYTELNWGIPKSFEDLNKHEATYILDKLHGQFVFKGVKGVCGYKQWVGK